MIAGLIRDSASGGAIGSATIVVRRDGELEPLRDQSDGNGAFMIPDLAPGPYEVTVYVQSVAVGQRRAIVAPGEVIGLDFAVGSVALDLNAPGAPALWHYRPVGAEPTVGTIEGTVADLHNARLPSAVVSVTPTGTVAAQQTITDEQGRYAVHELEPGSYEVSAYYSVVTSGTVEVRRSRVIVAGGEVVVVPLWLDTDGI